MVHSVLASLVHSLCTSAADPLSDLEGVRRAATGECDVVVCLFVDLSVSRCTLHTNVAVVVVYRYYTGVTTCSEVAAVKDKDSPLHLYGQAVYSYSLMCPAPLLYQLV